MGIADADSIAKRLAPTTAAAITIFIDAFMQSLPFMRHRTLELRRPT
jgi:hypothetical protein